MNNQLLLTQLDQKELDAASSNNMAATTSAATVISHRPSQRKYVNTRSSYERYLKSRYMQTTLTEKIPTCYVILYVLLMAVLSVGLILVELYALLISQVSLPTFYSGIW